MPEACFSDISMARPRSRSALRVKDESRSARRRR
jgi:hypothetical protein